MINHFHIAIIVPKRTPISDQELLRRFWILHRNSSRQLQREMERVEEHMGWAGKYLVKPRRAHLLPCELDGSKLAIPQRLRGPVLAERLRFENGR